MAAAAAVVVGTCEKLYLKDSGILHCSAVVRSVGSDAKGRFAFLNRTVFHPQGGGQPCDMGMLGSLRVVAVEKEGTPKEFDVKHYVEGDAALAEGDEVECAIDVVRRALNARLHSAGHLIAAVAEKALPGIKAAKGHHFPKEANVTFEKGDHTAAQLKECLERDLPQAIGSDAAVAILWDDKGGRTIQMGAYEPVPCGGTHVKSLGEIGSIVMRGVNLKSGQLRVSYDVAERA